MCHLFLFLIAFYIFHVYNEYDAISKTAQNHTACVHFQWDCGMDQKVIQIKQHQIFQKYIFPVILFSYFFAIFTVPLLILSKSS